jgi:hypothetical protein
MGDSKKAKAVRHTASGAGGAFAVVLLLNQFPGLLPYVMASEFADTAKTVTVVQTKLDSMEKGQDRLVTQSDQMSQMVSRIEGLLAGMASKVDVTLKENRDTVMVYFNVERGSGARSFWRRGPTTDSLMIPLVKDSL